MFTFIGDAYSRFGRLRRAVRPTTTSFWMATLISAKIVCKSWINDVICYLTQRIIHTENGISEVEYNYNGTKYAFLTTVRRGPRKVIKVTDENGDDITSYIAKYMGPGEDFHAFTPTPRVFNKKQMHFDCMYGQYDFSEDDAIIL
jgi:hypothetical protein